MIFHLIDYPQPISKEREHGEWLKVQDLLCSLRELSLHLKNILKILTPWGKLMGMELDRY